jgi:hypothetical protein
MKSMNKKLIIWSPRILCILFALFISLFALDVFNEGQGFWTTILALLIHLIPTAIIVVILILSWRRYPMIGAIGYFILGILYIIMAWGKFHWSAYAAISGPLIVIGILYYFNWIYRSELRNP